MSAEEKSIFMATRCTLRLQSTSSIHVGCTRPDRAVEDGLINPRLAGGSCEAQSSQNQMPTLPTILIVDDSLVEGMAFGVTNESLAIPRRRPRPGLPPG